MVDEFSDFFDNFHGKMKQKQKTIILNSICICIRYGVERQGRRTIFRRFGRAGIVQACSGILFYINIPTIIFI